MLRHQRNAVFRKQLSEGTAAELKLCWWWCVCKCFGVMVICVYLHSSRARVWVGYGHEAGEKVAYLLWKPKVFRRVYKIPHKVLYFNTSFVTARLYGEEFLGLRPNTNNRDHPLLSAGRCLFCIFAATRHISIRNMLCHGYEAPPPPHIWRREGMQIKQDGQCTYNVVAMEKSWVLRISVFVCSRV
jgi:hypothetical protein